MYNCPLSDCNSYCCRIETFWAIYCICFQGIKLHKNLFISNSKVIGKNSLSLLKCRTFRGEMQDTIVQEVRALKRIDELNKILTWLDYTERPCKRPEQCTSIVSNFWFNLEIAIISLDERVCKLYIERNSFLLKIKVRDLWTKMY